MSRLTDSGVITQAPTGIFRQVEQPTDDNLARSGRPPAARPGRATWPR
ncbi:MAG: hypothetical protein M3353_01940 [Actinomycetota bacterium]|nr:hypothetical protein [Actinomycetota bacterium]